MSKLVTLGAAVACLAVAPTASAGDGSDWLPLKGDSIYVSCTFNANCSNRFHSGGAIDFLVKSGRPVYATGNGTVTQALGGCAPGVVGCNSTRGNFVVISHGSHASRYLHLSRIVKASGSVKAGQLIGYSGISGTNIAHLHYDELTNPTFGTGKKNPGTLLACHGSRRVGYGNWPGLESTHLRNTGYGCLTGSSDPRGNFEKASSPAVGKVRVTGWAFDPDAKTHQLLIRAYLGGKAGGRGVAAYSLGRAGGSRPDVARAFNGVGSGHGFDALFKTSRRGRTSVCVYAVDVGPGSTKLLGCKAVTIKAEKGSVPPGMPAPSGTTVDVAAGAGGQLILAAVKESGSLYTRTGQVGQDWSDFYLQGDAGTWATASVAIGSDGKYRLLATKKSGSLYYRIGTPGQGWSSFDPVGVAGSWAPTEQPDLVAGPSGQLLMAAVKKSGTLYTRSAQIGVGWSDFVKQGDDDSWATASVAIGSDGQYRLLATKKTGSLYYRIGAPDQSWGEFERQGIAGSWAPTEQPDIAAGPNGELILAAIKASGSLYTRTAQIGVGWSDFFLQGVENSWATASVAIGSDGQYRLLATKKDGDLYYATGIPGQGWEAFERQGVAGSWAPTEQPDIAAGPNGELILAAIKKTGSLYTRLGQIGAGWSDFFGQGDAGSWATFPPS